MPQSSFVDLPLGKDQRIAFVDASLASWAKGAPAEVEVLMREVSSEIRSYMETFFHGGCEWKGLYPAIDGGIERQRYFLTGLFWLALEFGYAGMAKVLASVAPDSGYTARPEWSSSEGRRTCAFFMAFMNDVRAQIMLEREGAAASKDELFPVILH